MAIVVLVILSAFVGVCFLCLGWFEHDRKLNLMHALIQFLKEDAQDLKKRIEAIEAKEREAKEKETYSPCS